MRYLIAQKPTYKFSHNYTTTPVTTSAWQEIISAMPSPACAVEIFSASAATIKLSVGDAGDEDNHEINYYVIPGGSSILLPLEFSRGSRLSAKAVDSDADSGSLVLNFFG